jgi:predicted NUDIX family NTP pyrophosphohydrolase
MGKKRSAGILLYRRRQQAAEVLLVHAGGPFWAGKDETAWSIPKGEIADDEDALDTARREFAEETGLLLHGPFVALGEARQAGGKIVQAWTAEGDFATDRLRSNTCKIEWPPRSGRFAEFPEIDRAAWFTTDVATSKLHKGQAVFVERLKGLLAGIR